MTVNRFCGALHQVLMQHKLYKSERNTAHTGATGRKSEWLLLATHFSMKKPGSQGCSGVSVAGRNIRWPSFVGPSGVEGGLT